MNQKIKLCSKENKEMDKMRHVQLLTVCYLITPITTISTYRTTLPDHRCLKVAASKTTDISSLKGLHDVLEDL